MVPPHEHRRGRPRTIAPIALALGALAGAAGCATPIAASCDDQDVPAPELGAFYELPRARLGCLPFPGPFTLFAKADAANLGDHSYSGALPAGKAQEVDRGIIYTCRAGFIDICHVRNSADTVAYLHARLAYALRNDWTCVQFRLHEPSVYHVTIDYPRWWASIDPGEKLALTDELAIRMAQRLAMTAMTWHELLTWYGYKSTVVVSEHGSAFTYEDSVSHVVGVLVAGDALRHGGDYDEAVTEALNTTLARLDPVDQDQLDQAIDAVEGEWWADGQTIKRDLDISDSNVIQAWLVPGLACCSGAAPARLHIPDLRRVMGRDLTGLYRVSIEPNVLENDTILAKLPRVEDGSIDPARDFPVLIADIRDEIGPENARPGFAEHDEPTIPGAAARSGPGGHASPNSGGD